MANFTALNSTFTACMDNLSFIETVRRVKRNHHRVILIRPSVKPAAPLIDRCSSTGSWVTHGVSLLLNQVTDVDVSTMFVALAPFG